MAVAMLAALTREYIHAFAHFGPDARRLLAAVALSSFARQSFAVLRNLYLKELGHGEDRIGLVVSSLSIGQAAIAIPAIIIMARLGLRRGLLIAIAAEAAAGAIHAGTTDYVPILVATGVMGAASTLFVVIAQPFCMRITRPEERPYMFSAMFTTMMVAGALGSSFGGALAQALAHIAGDAVLGFRIALALLALAYVAAIPWFARLTPDEDRTVTTTGSGRVEPVSLRAALRVHAPRRILLLAIPEALIGCGAGLTIPFLQLYFRNTFNQGSFAIGVIYMLGYFGMAAGYLVAPAIARRAGAWRVIVLSQAISTIFLLELAFPHGLYLAVASFILRTTLMNLAAPVYSQFSLEVVDPADQRAVSSVLSLVRGVSWGIANLIGGILIHARGGDFSATIALTAALYLVGAVAGAKAYSVLERTRPLRASAPSGV